MVSIIERQRLVKIIGDAAVKEMLGNYDPAFVFEFWPYLIEKETNQRPKGLPVIGPKGEK